MILFLRGSDNSVKKDGFPYRDSIFAQIDIPVPFRLYIPAVSEESSSAEPTVRVFFCSDRNVVKSSGYDQTAEKIEKPV